MASVELFLSTTSDGSMLSRQSPTDPEVIANRKRFLESQGVSFETTTRVSVNMLERATVTHDTDYCRYSEVTPDHVGDGMSAKETVVADALITAQKDQALMLPVADCVGAVLFDPAHSVLMVSHLGRHSLEQQGALRSFNHLVTRYGSSPSDIKVWLTPAPGKEHYQIWALNNKGMKEATFEQLYAAGIKEENITDDPRDTVTDLDFYSYSEFLKGNRKEDGDHTIVAVMK